MHGGKILINKFRSCPPLLEILLQFSAGPHLRSTTAQMASLKRFIAASSFPSCRKTILPSRRPSTLSVPTRGYTTGKFRPHVRSLLRIEASRDSGTITFTSSQLQGSRSTGLVKSSLYAALSLALAGAGTMLMSSPAQTLEYISASSPTLVLSGLLVTYGSLQLLAAATMACLSHAALTFRLTSDTYKRLNAGSILWGLASLTVYATGPLMSSSVTSKAVVGLFALCVAVPLLCSEGLVTPLYWKLKLLPRFNAEEAYRLGMLASLAFGALTLYTASSAAVPIAFTAITVPIGSVGQLVVRLFACGTLLTAPILYSLADADRRCRLAASTFRILNLGVAGLCSTVLVVLRKGTLVKAGPKLGLVVQAPPLPASFADAWMRWPDMILLAGTGILALLAVVSLFQTVFARDV